MLSQDLIVRFKAPARTSVPDADGPFCEEVERFSAADPRWRTAIEMAAARLSPSARCTLGVALSGLEAGPAPRLMPFDFGPDDAWSIERESAHMSPTIRSALEMLAACLGLRAVEIAYVHGVVSAVHRLLRVAKTRP